MRLGPYKEGTLVKWRNWWKTWLFEFKRDVNYGWRLWILTPPFSLSTHTVMPTSYWNGARINGIVSQYFNLRIHWFFGFFAMLEIYLPLWYHREKRNHGTE